jgi:PAS domain S-box-containing protein
MQEDGVIPIQISKGDFMKDDDKTKEQLLNELTELRLQNALLKKTTAENIPFELAVEEARRYAESIVETVREPLLVLDEDLKIISANRSFYSTFKVTPGETIGNFIYNIGNGQWNPPILRHLLENILPEKEVFNDFEVTHNFQNIGLKIMLLNARQVYRKDINAKMILIAFEDITERKKLEDLLIVSEERYRRLFETASDAIVLIEKLEGKIVHINPAAEKMLGYTKKESIGKVLQDIGVLLDMGDVQATMQALVKSGLINYNDIPITTKSGRHIDADIYISDRAILAQCNLRDITDRKHAQDEILNLNENLKQDINQRMADLEELNKVFVGRELRMIELKARIVELEKKT